MSNRTPELGDEVRCKITGFTGVITAHARHLTGCDRFWVQPPVDAEGKGRTGLWLDIDVLAILRPGLHAPVAYARAAPGGMDLPASR